jgi:hypothetical protein
VKDRRTRTSLRIISTKQQTWKQIRCDDWALTSLCHQTVRKVAKLYVQKAFPFSGSQYYQSFNCQHKLLTFNLSDSVIPLGCDNMMLEQWLSCAGSFLHCLILEDEATTILQNVRTTHSTVQHHIPEKPQSSATFQSIQVYSYGLQCQLSSVTTL